jgi:Ca2+-binding RTX toxin-like protein
MRRVLVIAAALSALAPGAAHAGTATLGSEDGVLVLRYVAGPAEVNALSVSRSGGDYVVNDPAGVTNGPGCDFDTPTRARCPGPAPGDQRLVATLGDEDDGFSASAPFDRVTVDGGFDRDTLNGTGNDDRFSGGPGDDALSGGAGADRFRGGDGFDTLAAGEYRFPGAVRIVQDDQAGDGRTGENDDVGADVERVIASEAADTLTGGAGRQVLDAAGGNDTLGGGAGADVLQGGYGSDVIDAQEGEPDDVSCGPGGDRVRADSYDTLSGDCETVERTTQVGPFEDLAPTVDFTSPGQNTTVRPTNLVLRATAGDDRGVARVVFLDDGELVGEDGEAPYEVPYVPSGDDVGRRNLFTAVAHDTAGQTAHELRSFTVGRYTPRFSIAVSPRRDHRKPHRFRTTGRLAGPAPITPEEACRGRVTIIVKAGRRVLSTRTASITSSCRFSSRVTFKSRRRFPRSRSLRFTARFTGNSALLPVTARSVNRFVR